jgi:hypothetical protein
MDELWTRVAHIAHARVEVVEQALHELRAVDPRARVTAQRARDECHKLVGSLDSYGKVGGSALAARAEAILAGTLADPVTGAAAALDELAAIVSRLRVLVASG